MTLSAFVVFFFFGLFGLFTSWVSCMMTKAHIFSLWLLFCSMHITFSNSYPKWHIKGTFLSFTATPLSLSPFPLE
ncbi:hypothetical protein BDP81DRAFT_6129 [Colletotrichum phormii]|uniref:Uncharacterized protein n=1 Tax=Colletotrichum phormii TaxID=359342 RepID=A0AAJ0A336_9PEZI|nr:uncharacterized protein BDP81DRAFT_6129 [Colletotrichum phormii]KAK1655565.1 hypothetical protein BDP81DRAFT_6129 [Colletotrichum phormii]